VGSASCSFANKGLRLHFSSILPLCCSKQQSCTYLKMALGFCFPEQQNSKVPKFQSCTDSQRSKLTFIEAVQYRSMVVDGLIESIPTDIVVDTVQQFL